MAVDCSNYWIRSASFRLTGSGRVGLIRARILYNMQICGFVATAEWKRKVAWSEANYAARNANCSAKDGAFHYFSGQSSVFY